MMGDRISINFVNGAWTSPALFSHWQGTSLLDDVETYLDETHGDYGVQLSLLSYTTRRELEDHLAGYVQPHDGQVEHATLSDQSGTLRIRLPGMSLIEAAYTIAAILELDEQLNSNYKKFEAAANDSRGVPSKKPAPEYFL